MNPLVALSIFLLAAGAALIVWLALSARQSARRLDERIEEYHAEGPPADPYSELAKLMGEDAQSRPGRAPKKPRSGPKK